MSCVSVMSKLEEHVKDLENGQTTATEEKRQLIENSQHKQEQKRTSSEKQV